MPTKENEMSYTLLETINYVISQTGAAPVDDVNDPLPDVASATLRINEAVVKTLKRGWWFNTNYNVQITKDVDDKYPIPTDTIKILRASPFFVLDRGGFAYDPYNQTTVFPEGEDTLCVDLIYKLDYDLCPYTVQDLIRAVAAREHIIIELEDMRKADTLTDDINAALMDMRKDDLEIKRRNIAYNPKFIRTRGGVRPYRFGGRGVNPNRPGG